MQPHPRFYEVTSGRILIDGQDIRHVTLKSLRQDIGIVQQDVYLFSGTVAQNIAYGKPGATREEIMEAARLAGAEKFILALKDGFDTYVGERGVKLSGGQKQRIAIARVFLKNPPILILDEATSALDNESEILVGQSLEKLAHGRTTLTIAHRLTTIKDYDRILVLGEEGIVESGTHDQLLAKQGVYYRLWNQLPGKIHCKKAHIQKSSAASTAELFAYRGSFAHDQAHRTIDTGIVAEDGGHDGVSRQDLKA